MCRVGTLIHDGRKIEIGDMQNECVSLSPPSSTVSSFLPCAPRGSRTTVSYTWQVCIVSVLSHQFVVLVLNFGETPPLVKWRLCSGTNQSSFAMEKLHFAAAAAVRRNGPGRGQVIDLATSSWQTLSGIQGVCSEDRIPRTPQFVMSFLCSEKGRVGRGWAGSEVF
jgi:hypothetical protein